MSFITFALLVFTIIVYCYLPQLSCDTKTNIIVFVLLLILIVLVNIYEKITGYIKYLKKNVEDTSNAIIETAKQVTIDTNKEEDENGTDTDK